MSLQYKTLWCDEDIIPIIERHVHLEQLLLPSLLVRGKDKWCQIVSYREPELAFMMQAEDWKWHPKADNDVIKQMQMTKEKMCSYFQDMSQSN